MKTCEQCKAECPDHAGFCNMCGHPFPAAPLPETSAPSPTEQPPPQQYQTAPPETPQPQQYHYPPPPYAPPPYAPPPYNAPPYNAPPPPRKKKTSLVLAIVGAALFAFVAIALTFVFLFRLVGDTTPDFIQTTPVPVPVHTLPPSPEPTPPPSVLTGERSRTFMIYIVGSDLESSAGLASLDIEEILSADIDYSWNNVVIQTGGASFWWHDAVSASKTEIFEIDEDGIRNVHEEPRRNMADPATLTDFLAFCYENYQTDAYSLILWNHGAGPMFGFGYDEIAHDILFMPQIVEALEKSPFGADNKLEFIGFDACLMGSVEIGFALRDYADYMIASQETIPGWGWDYSFLEEIEPGMTTEEVAVSIIDYYIDFCMVLFAFYPELEHDISLSNLDLSKISAVEAELNGLYGRVGGGLNATTFPDSAKIRVDAKTFGVFTTLVSYDLVDMHHLCELMRVEYPAEADRLADALKELVVYNRTNILNAGGVSLYYPYDDKALMAEMALFYENFNFAGDYTDYIQRFVALLQDGTAAEWSMAGAEVGQEGQDGYFVQLTQEQADTFARANFTVIKKEKLDTGEEAYAILFLSRNVDLDESGRLTANYDGRVLNLLDEDTGETYNVFMEEIDSTATEIRYFVYALLQNVYSGWTMDNAYLQVATDADGRNARILSAVPFSDDDEDEPQGISRPVIDIYDYDAIAFWYGFKRFLTYHDDGSLKHASEWELVGIMEGIEFVLAEDSFSFVREEIDSDGEYYIVFNIADVYGNFYASGLIPMGG